MARAVKALMAITAMNVARKVDDELGRRVVGVTIDYGYELMYAVEPAYAVYLARFLDVPLPSIHINTAKTHSNDEDRVVGTGGYVAIHRLPIRNNRHRVQRMVHARPIHV